MFMIMKWNKDDKYLPEDERQPIYIYINSDGGEMIAGSQVLSLLLLLLPQLLL